MTVFASAADEPQQAAAPIRCFSFNIRYGTARDGQNAWELRRERVFETIRQFEPDLLGTQETLAFQRDELLAALPGYTSISAGRDNGAEAGEMTAVFARRDRFELIKWGHFWLSRTPDRPGTISWDSSLTRMCTWVKLTDRQRPDRTPVVFNTHFDHRGAQARVESARLLRRKIAEIADGLPVIVMGDFNAAEASEPYQTLFSERSDAVPGTPLLDTYRVVHPEPQPQEGTAGGFTLAERGKSRIDWIGCSKTFTVVDAGIDRTHVKGRTPSDHFPVFAVVR